MERKERVEQESKSIDQFILTLQQSGSIDTEKSIEENIATLSFATDVQRTAVEYLERARGGVG
jgi:hypothetical protein